MELGKYGTLREYIEINGPLNENICAEVGYKILNAITYLHERNIIHRDIKCSNILLS
jgi:serine/threonine protein kinase